MLNCAIMVLKLRFSAANEESKAAPRIPECSLEVGMMSSFSSSSVYRNHLNSLSSTKLAVRAGLLEMMIAVGSVPKRLHVEVIKGAGNIELMQHRNHLLPSSQPINTTTCPLQLLLLRSSSYVELFLGHCFNLIFILFLRRSRSEVGQLGS